jgi:hypothetical protein
MKGHTDKVRAALYRGEADCRLLDGRNFDAIYWQRARASLSVLTRQLEMAQRERDTFRALMAGTPSEDT